MNEIGKCVKFIKDNGYIFVDEFDNIRTYYKSLDNGDVIKIQFLSNHISFYYEVVVRRNDVIISTLPLYSECSEKLKELIITNKLV